MSSIKPIFRIFDIDKAREFYIDWLGFTVDWEHRYGDNFPVYMQVSLDDIVLHLSEHHGDASPGSKIFIEYTGDLPAFHRELSAKHYKYNKPGLEDADWGGKCMEVIDPFGNKMLFSEKKDN
jgi:catechol 2,3-dioxygenase-like lactoylglutathione lyase family enzyme